MAVSKPYLETNSLKIGEGVEFGTNVSITADSVEIGDRVLLRNDIRINCRGKLRIGHHSILGSDARLQCNNLIIGSWLYSCDGLEIGSGGCNSKESDVTIGDRVGIFERVLINPNHKVSIGDNCGIGREVQIWTHGAWLDPLAGFPSDFGPVSIGSNVWLPARCVVLPNVLIGDNCVIGINSIVNKSIPSGSFAAGCPAKILKSDAYPLERSADEANMIIRGIVRDWETQIRFKRPSLNYSIRVINDKVIVLLAAGAETIFNCDLKTVSGETTDVSEDFRDYLRRRGIKIYTDNFFESIK
ncbi:DapH/DapD/GlmU-related protein [Mycolicibacterium sp.]|uniref:acyltransferase n=1 Tax=Mycolicibacterium sp. TaxID=2320850 RepID=UPI0025D44FC1|nr:DapH/DapD/GlmU-related protein [Mycolicibacterium sp.]MCB9409860.1 hypothetical protein [Mycolicibacterium sp.]